MVRMWGRSACTAALALGIALGAVAPAAHSAVPLGQPAFYTWQAPYDEWTAGQRVVALTFDDGPGAYTPQIMAVLEQYHVPATFFEVGSQVAAHPTMTADLAAAGFSVQDHTWNHPDLATLPVSQYPFEIDQTQSMISSVMGTTPICVRPPYDSWNATTLQQLAVRGLTTMSYSVDSGDWQRPGVQAIVNASVGSAFPGAVIGLHDGGGDRSQTVAALPQIISQLAARGYAFVSLCQAPAPPPPPPPQTSAVYGFGAAPVPGAPTTTRLRFTGLAADPSSGGYWLAAADGGVFSYAGAPYLGSLPGLGITPAAPVSALAATSTGHGYWMAGADGGVFTFGDAGFYGSMGAKPLNQPVVGIASDPATGGYWMVGADGGVFAFDAPFYGSRGAAGGPDRFFAIAATSGGAGYLLGAQHDA
ncbi:MAG TPA: polysaccharide deacetylase family protein [Acidimicrobiales bacterium]